MHYAFFFSYANADAKNEAVGSFFENLDSQLKIVHGENNVGRGGFLAPVSIQPGENWRKRALPEALNTASILVALHSPNYFGSEYCGKEFEVFRQRRQLFLDQRRGGAAPDCVIPVLWQDVYDPPPSMPDLQWKRADGAPQSEGGGLYAAWVDALNPQDVLRKSAFKLAVRISDLLRKNRDGLPSLVYTPDVDGIRSAFSSPNLPLPEIQDIKGAGPTSATFVYPRDMNSERSPFGPPLDRAAVSRAAAIAMARDMAVQGIAFDPDASGLEEGIGHAQELNSAVVLMLTGASVGHKNVMAVCERIKPDGIAGVLIDGKRQDVDRIPGRFVGTLRANDLFFPDVIDAASLDRAIKRSLGTLYNKLSQAGNMKISRPTAHNTLPQA